MVLLLKMTSPNQLLAHLTPMRPILCIVGSSGGHLKHGSSNANSNNIGKGDTSTPSSLLESWKFGMALSDPYLGMASPLSETAEDMLDVRESIQEYRAGALLFSLPLLPMTQRKCEKLKLCNHMIDLHNDEEDQLIRRSEMLKEQNDAEHMMTIQDRMRLIKELGGNPEFIGDGDETNEYDNEYKESEAGVMWACSINSRLRLDECKLMADLDFDQWQDIDLDCDDDESSLNRDAAVALNHFLWVHTGGWRNTFG